LLYKRSTQRSSIFAQIHPPQTLRYNESSVCALKVFSQTTFWRKHRMKIAPPTPRVRPVFFDVPTGAHLLHLLIEAEITHEYDGCPTRP
jgi:hypothetical protein